MSIRPPLPLLPVLAFLAACSAPLQVRLREPVALHPLAVAPEAPALAVAGDLPGPARDDGDEARRPRADGGARGGGAATADPPTGRLALSATTAAPSLVPAGGQARADLVASAVRLVGIRGSFDERSFLGHVLRINDLLPAGAVSASYGAAQSLQAARAAALLRPAAGARAGDLAFFRCPGRCGDAAEGEPAGAIVESAGEGGTTLVCYLEEEVRRCRPDGGPGKEGRPVGDLLGVADPWSLAAAVPGVSPAAKPRP